MATYSNFGDAIRGLTRRFDAYEQKVIREKNKFDLELQQDMVRQSPVDSGKFASNMRIQASARSTAVKRNPYVRGTHGSAKAANQAKSRVAAEATLKKREGGKLKPLYLINNHPAVAKLEGGHSKQASAGWIRRSIKKHEVKLNQLVKRIKVSD